MPLGLALADIESEPIERVLLERLQVANAALDEFLCVFRKLLGHHSDNQSLLAYDDRRCVARRKLRGLDSRHDIGQGEGEVLAQFLALSYLLLVELFLEVRIYRYRIDLAFVSLLQKPGELGGLFVAERFSHGY